jgi:hypothetical protein
VRELLFLVLVAALVLPACNEDPGPAAPAGIPDETDGRITIVNDETRLASRVTILDDSVTVTQLSKAAQPAAFRLKLVAEIAPPVVKGERLQATSVTLKSNFAYVSYNMRGSVYLGGVDVVQVKGASNATLRSSAHFADTDVSSAYYDGNAVYLAAASGDPSADAPAYAEVVRTDGSSKFNLLNRARQVLTSYVATSVYASAGVVYVTTGNTGGLYRLNHSSQLSVAGFQELDDARWVDVEGSYCVVAQGTPGRLAVLDRVTLAPIRTITFQGANIPESKSTVRLIGGKALVAAGDGGVKLIDLASGVLVGSIPRPVVPGLDPSVTVTNAVDAAERYVYISNGEAGIYVAEASENLEDNTGSRPITLTVLGKLQFASLQSANHVAYDGSVLLVASGLGGTKVVTVNY